MFPHIRGKFTMGKLKSSLLSSFVLNRHSLSISRCRSRYEADLSVSVVSFYFKRNGIDTINEITNYVVKGHHLYNGT
jgi:hypothetical protein